MFWINSCCWITVWKSPWKPTDTRGIQTQQSSNICIVLMTCQLKSVYIFVPSQKELSQICTSQKYMYFLCLFFIGLFVYHWATQRFQLLSQHVKQLHLSEVTFGIQRAENVVSTVSGSWFPKSLWVGMPPPNTRCFKALCGCPNISKPKVFGSCWKTREYVRNTTHIIPCPSNIEVVKCPSLTWLYSINRLHPLRWMVFHVVMLINFWNKFGELF